MVRTKHLNSGLMMPRLARGSALALVVGLLAITTFGCGSGGGSAQNNLDSISRTLVNNGDGKCLVLYNTDGADPHYGIVELEPGQSATVRAKLPPGMTVSYTVSWPDGQKLQGTFSGSGTTTFTPARVWQEAASGSGRLSQSGDAYQVVIQANAAAQMRVSAVPTGDFAFGVSLQLWRDGRQIASSSGGAGQGVSLTFYAASGASYQAAFVAATTNLSGTFNYTVEQKGGTINPVGGGNVVNDNGNNGGDQGGNGGGDQGGGSTYAALNAPAGKSFGEGGISDSSIAYTGTGRDWVKRLLERTPGPWSIPSSAVGVPPTLQTLQAVFGTLDSLTDTYLAAAVVEAWGAESLARSGDTASAQEMAKSMLANLRNAEAVGSGSGSKLTSIYQHGEYTGRRPELPKTVRVP